MANRRRRKKGSALPTVLVLLVAVGLIGFVVYQALGSSVQRTATIGAGNMGNQYAAQAVIIRNEKLKDIEGLTSIKYYADEGETVYKGNRIAQVYSSGYSQTDINKLANVRANIKEQLKILSASGYNDVRLDRLDSQVLDYVREIGMLVQNGERGNLVNMERQLTGSMEDRQAYLKEKYASSNSTLMGYYSDEATLKKKIDSWTTTFLAETDCIVSFYTDGYETVLTPDAVETLDLPMARSVLAGDAPALTTSQRGRTAIFREVQPAGWHLLLLSHDKAWSPVNGESYEVRLSGTGETTVTGVVTSFARAGNDLLVRMRVEGDVRPVLNVRTSDVVVGQLYASALQVPLGAIHHQGGQVGVVLTDSGGVFVPVTVIDQNHDYAFIQPLLPGALQQGQKVRVF